MLAKIGRNKYYKSVHTIAAKFRDLLSTKLPSSNLHQSNTNTHSTNKFLNNSIFYGLTKDFSTSVDNLNFPSYIDKVEIEKKNQILRFYLIPVLHSRIYEKSDGKGSQGGSGEAAACFIRILRPKFVFLELCEHRLDSAFSRTLGKLGVMHEKRNEFPWFADEELLFQCKYKGTVLLPRIHGGFLYGEFQNITELCHDLGVPIIPIDRPAKVTSNRLFGRLLHSRINFEGFLSYCIDSVSFRNKSRNLEDCLDLYNSLLKNSPLSHEILVEERAIYMANQIFNSLMKNKIVPLNDEIKPDSSEIEFIVICNPFCIPYLRLNLVKFSETWKLLKNSDIKNLLSYSEFQGFFVFCRYLILPLLVIFIINYCILLLLKRFLNLLFAENFQESKLCTEILSSNQSQEATSLEDSGFSIYNSKPMLE